jgi:tetratricopeptide (TPR) repeat protein
MIHRMLLLLSLLLLGSGLYAQDARLAQQYFQNGEYEKAADTYNRLYQQNASNDYFFNRYVECLIALKQYEEGVETVKRQLRRFPDNPTLYVMQGQLLERLYQDAEAARQYALAIDKLTPDQYSVTVLANAFVNLAKYDLAVAAYEKGAALLKDNRVFAYNMAELYRRMGETPKMVENYLNAITDNPERLTQLQTIFQRFFSVEDYEELQRQLYLRINADDNNILYPELLAWIFIQRKDYRNALRQQRALDARLNENGNRVYQLGLMASTDKEYDAAIAAFDYIVEVKGTGSTLYLDAKREGLRNRRLKLTEGYNFTREELLVLEGQYDFFLTEFGKNRTTAGIMFELAELEAMYLFNGSRAIALLDSLINLPGVDPILKAQAKLNLGDYYLMGGEIWEATLLYSQVDKSFKEDALGHEARFRNARLSYFTRDFQWAQAQFDVLKASTSKLIANDALDLSIFIMDNMGLDTSDVALGMYAEAEWLAFQNRFSEATAKMDSLLSAFPEHSLQDDVLYLRATLEMKQRRYETAAALFQQVVDGFPTDIRADNALFNLAELYEQQLGNKDKAMELYEKIFVDYSSSTFAVEARKRFRKLRGDAI